ncbi:MAG TPA: hypothetical protein PKA93_10160, partial [Arachnia sp.]|nr:hypothetical protein [Arachnia sp.]
MTRFRFWEPIPLYVALRTLTDQTILALPPGKDVAPIVFSVGYPSEDHIALRYARLPDLDKASSLLAPNQTLEVALRLFTLGAGVECIAVPPIQWPGRGDGLALRIPVAGVGALAAGAAPLILGGTIGAAFALPAAALAYLVLWSALRRRRGARVLTAGDLHLDGTNLVDYAIARRLGEPATARTDRERHARVAKRIDDIRADYGRRSADIAYRIENSALFDAAVPTTAALEVALVRGETEAASLSLGELEALATDLEIAYSVAVDHAETVGFQHLPSTARDDARRAHKAAQLAEGAATAFMPQCGLAP